MTVDGQRKIVLVSINDDAAVFRWIKLQSLVGSMVDCKLIVFVHVLLIQKHGINRRCDLKGRTRLKALLRKNVGSSDLMRKTGQHRNH